MRSRRRLLIGLLTLSVIEAIHLAGLAAPSSPPGPRELLRSIGQFTNAEWAAVERGESIAHLLDTSSREIAVVGAVRIAASPEALFQRYRDIENLKRSALVLDASRLNAPPSPSDMARLPLEEYSLNLRHCRPGDCPVRLDVEGVRRFQREVNWNGSDWRQQSASIWREVLSSYVAGYVSGGRKALPDYVNKQDPLSAADELALLVREYRFIADYAPELHAYLQDLGSRPPAGAEQQLFWTKEDFGVRPILRISHQILYRVSSPVPVAFVVTNQIYADHYLDAAFGVTLAIDASDRDKMGQFYLISVNRARTRSLGGLLRSFVRSTVQNRSREALRKLLTNTKAALETRR